jgi:amino acid transporter
MVNYKELNVADPLAYVFTNVGFDAVAGIISVSAVVAITSALLAYQIGQPRIWMTMSRDGLLGKKFGEIHPKFKTPAFATIITGILVAVPSLFFKMSFFVDLTSVGTFFAFILVCAGVLYLDTKGMSKDAKFKIPYINAKYLCGILMIGALYFTYSQGNIMQHVEEKPLLFVFWAVWLALSLMSFKYNFSLLPIFGILTNLYLMTELGWTNWRMFIIWMSIGLVIYFSYGYSHSKLAKK